MDFVSGGVEVNTHSCDSCREPVKSALMVWKELVHLIFSNTGTLLVRRTTKIASTLHPETPIEEGIDHRIDHTVEIGKVESDLAKIQGPSGKFDTGGSWVVRHESVERGRVNDKITSNNISYKPALKKNTSVII